MKVWYNLSTEFLPNKSFKTHPEFRPTAKLLLGAPISWKFFIVIIVSVPYNYASKEISPAINTAKSNDTFGLRYYVI